MVFTGRVYLRSDFTEYTAKTYAKNCSIKDDYLPLDFNHTKESYWLKRLREDKSLTEYLGKNVKEIK